MAGALLAMLLAALDSSIVNTALPRMAVDLGGLARLSWVVTAFMLSSTISTPIYGKLSDSYGRRVMFAVSIGIFLLGSILCGMAWSMDALIVFRALQGFGAGGLLVLAQASIGDVISPRERPRYQGLFAGTFGLAGAAGPLLGGVITQALSWRWIFYVNLPLGALAFAMIWLGLKQAGSARAGAAPRIDYAGTLLLAATTSALMLLLASGGRAFAWASWQALGMGLFTLLCLGLFLWRETWAPEPLIRLMLFRNRIFARGTAVGGMATFAMFGALVFMPLYFQLVLGMSPSESGLMILPQVGCMLFSSVLGGRIVARFGHYRPFLLGGMALEAGALGALAVLAYVGAPPWLFIVNLGLLGLGMGSFMPNLTNAVQNAVPHAQLGAATGAMVFIRSLGGAVGVAASGAMMTARLGRLPGGVQHAAALAYRHALTGSFLMSGLVMFAGFLLVLGLPEIPLRNQVGDNAPAR